MKVTQEIRLVRFVLLRRKLKRSNEKQKQEKLLLIKKATQMKMLDIKSKALQESLTLCLSKCTENAYTVEETASSESFSKKFDEMNEKIEMINKRYEKTKTEAMEWKKKFLDQEKRLLTMQQLYNLAEDKVYIGSDEQNRVLDKDKISRKISNADLSDDETSDMNKKENRQQQVYDIFPKSPIASDS